MRVLCDLDGVVVDLLTKWLGVYNAEWNDTMSASDLFEWFTHRSVKLECGVKIYEIIKRPGFFDDLEPLPGALEGIDSLHSAGIDLTFVSTPACADSARAKYEWVDRFFPFHELILTSDKARIIGDVLIDDAPHNLSSFPGKTICVDYPYNRNTPADFRVTGYLAMESAWHEIVRIVMSLDALDRGLK